MFKAENDHSSGEIDIDQPAVVKVNPNSAIVNIVVNTTATAGTLAFSVKQRNSETSEPLLVDGTQVEMDLSEPSRTIKIEGFAIKEASTVASGMDQPYSIESSSGDK